MPYDPYAKRPRQPDVWSYRWCLEPAGETAHGQTRTHPRRFFPVDDLDGLKAAYRAAEASGLHPAISQTARVVPGNGRSPRSYPMRVHVSWLGHDVWAQPPGVPSRPRPGSPEAEEEARLDAEWDAEQAALAAAATA